MGALNRFMINSLKKSKTCHKSMRYMAEALFHPFMSFMEVLMSGNLVCGLTTVVRYLCKYSLKGKGKKGRKKELCNKKWYLLRVVLLHNRHK